ncbi:hypothetical protein WP1_084 [Pseudomonas phage WP1]
MPSTPVFGSHAVVIAVESRQHFMLVDQREILQRFDILRITNSRLRTIHADNPHRIARKTELTGRILENAIRADWTALNGHISIFVNFSFRLLPSLIRRVMDHGCIIYAGHPRVNKRNNN